VVNEGSLVQEAYDMFGSLRGLAGLAAARAIADLRSLSSDGLTLNAVRQSISK
jgi:hypothetical protein